MKKFIIIAVLVALAITGGLLIRQPETEAEYMASSFMPADEDLSNIALAGFENIGVGMQKTAKTLDFFSSMEEDLDPKAKQIKAIGQVISSKLKEYAPMIKDTSLMFSIRPDGLSVQPRFWGALGIDSPDAKQLVDSFADQLATTDPELVIFPYTAELGEKAESMYQVMDTDSGLTIFTALFDSDPSYVLAATSEESLADMIETADNEEIRYVPNRHYQHRDFIYATVENRVLRLAMLEQEATIQSDDPLEFESVFYTEENRFITKIYTNAANLVADGNKLGSVSFLPDTETFYGGARTLGFIMGRMSGLNRQYVQDLLTGTEGQETREALDKLEKEYGITLQDVIDLFNGEISLVLGGKAGSIIGRIPGLYLLIKPEKEGIASRFSSIVPELGIPVPINEPAIEGWDQVYSMSQFISLTVASRTNELLLGILDAYELNNPSEIPTNLQPFLKVKNHGLFALSVKDTLPVLNDLAIRLQSFRPDPSLSEARIAMNRVLENIETFSLVSLSTEEVVLTIAHVEQE